MEKFLQHVHNQSLTLEFTRATSLSNVTNVVMLAILKEVSKVILTLGMFPINFEKVIVIFCNEK